GTISLLLIGQFLLGGALLYAAYNTRTIYQFAIVGLLLIIFVQRKTGRQKGRLVTANDFAVVAIVAGLLLGSVPQVIINHNHTGELTMTAINSEAAAQWRGGQQSLNVFQLEHGLRLNLYETWNGDDGLAARVGYVNHSGIHILNEAYFSGISLPLGSLGDYFRAVARFPLEALGTYVRHLIVLLNPISGGGYIYSRTNMRFVYTMLNYTMLFVVFGWLKRSFLDGTLREIRQKVDTKERATSLICLLTILLPFIFILPGAVEERFAIGFWVIIYGVIFYCIDFRQEWAKYRARPFAHGFFYLAGFGVFIAILTEIYVHSSHGFLPILNLQ
ncbi:MAG: hypothetical protein FWG68_06480, partial [Defluviitaleaceae bacterium]|nr:hypothetical protein [Defluviitaleaceae bacterium]